ncbi:LysR family transcriptional regulator [Streptomyces sp. NPDC046977]|uniref:LysR family transcriptional regulator n=1 Tax=Streptomyces sp. NPDC046977 TaxID=3154703 RepID=UPI0033E5172A
MDLDLRKLRYFVAVAEELHFGRAAERLHIAQPVLSRQIRSLEHELRAQLFSRDRRSTALTPAGEQLLADAGPLLAAAQAAQRRVARAAHGGPGTFTVGFMPGLIVTGAVREFSGRHQGLSVEVVRTGWNDQAEAVRDGRVDVGYVRMPLDARGLGMCELMTEPRVAVLPADHRYAGKHSLSIADLAGEHLLQDPDAVPEWRDIAQELRTAGPAPVPAFRTVEEKLESVAAGRGVVVLPLSTASYYTRPDVTHVELSDIGPNRVCLAWDGSRHDALVQEFVSVALALAHRHPVP